jgi:hypothetical protein
MIQTKWCWKKLTNDGRLLPLPDELEDENFFDTGGQAIEWLKAKNKTHNDELDPMALTLVKLYFTR